MKKAYSRACENNKAPILAQLTRWFAQSRQVFEIGSGTGQHSVHFAPALTHLLWQTSDLIVNHDTIQIWREEAQCPNLLPPLEFQVGVHDWPLPDVDAVFTSNTTHIMQPELAKLMMTLVAENLATGGVFCQYGPFKLEGEFTTQSNRDFDTSLKQRGFGGLRDIAELKHWASGLTLIKQIDMPANNFLLVWQKP